MGGKKPNPFLGCTWESLADKIAPEVLRAPKTGGEWPAVHERIVRYLLAVFVNDIGGQFLIRIGARDSFEWVTDNQIWGPCDNEKGNQLTF